MKAESTQYLIDNNYVYEAHKVGCYNHLSEEQAQTFLAIAQEIQPGIQFQIIGCQSCVNELVKFVYTESERKGKAVRMKFDIK